MSPIIGAHVSMIPMRVGWIFLSDTWGVPIYLLLRVHALRACMVSLPFLVRFLFALLAGARGLCNFFAWIELDFSFGHGTEGGRNA